MPVGRNPRGLDEAAGHSPPGLIRRALSNATRTPETIPYAPLPEFRSFSTPPGPRFGIGNSSIRWNLSERMPGTNFAPTSRSSSRKRKNAVRGTADERRETPPPKINSVALQSSSSLTAPFPNEARPHVSPETTGWPSTEPAGRTEKLVAGQIGRRYRPYPRRARTPVPSELSPSFYDDFDFNIDAVHDLTVNYHTECGDYFCLAPADQQPCYTPDFWVEKTSKCCLPGCDESIEWNHPSIMKHIVNRHCDVTWQILIKHLVISHRMGVSVFDRAQMFTPW
ncbi:hypothetical protein CPC08DRAFT_753574 [Agrocybe pediades]|nr:hypothetical protein CPC08DRAFT_753574 [Agrocybe pediades]